jgi:hypothetical protein
MSDCTTTNVSAATLLRLLSTDVQATVNATSCVDTVVCMAMGPNNTVPLPTMPLSVLNRSGTSNTPAVEVASVQLMSPTYADASRMA